MNQANANKNKIIICVVQGQWVVVTILRWYIELSQVKSSKTLYAIRVIIRGMVFFFIGLSFYFTFCLTVSAEPFKCRFWNVAQNTSPPRSHGDTTRWIRVRVDRKKYCTYVQHSVSQSSACAFTPNFS